jgi:elongation factor G
MAGYLPKDIVNIAFVGHSDSGKTTLADAILFKTKANSRFGSIDEGTSIFDFDPEEKERKVSIDLAIASCRYNNREINLLDAPGYYDFVGEAISAIRAVENIAICINASSGIMVNTRKMWDLARRSNAAKIVVITKMDLENVNYGELLDRIKETFGESCVPLILPGSLSGRFERVFNVLDASQIPGELEELATASRERFMELDDTILEKYLEGGRFSLSDFEKVLPSAMLEGRIIPIFCLSSKADIGVKEFLDFITRFSPTPADLPAPKGIDPEKNQELQYKADPSAPLSGLVFKSISDPFVGRLSFVKIFSGSLLMDTPIFIQRTARSERIGNLFKPFGKDQRPLREATAGDIVGLTKVEDICVSDTICTPSHPIRYTPLEFPTPMVSLAVEPKTKADEQRLSTSLQRMADSDPTFRVTRDRETLELVITGMSQLHIDVVLSRMKRRYDVELLTKMPKIAYKETVTALSQGHYKHKKQTGGRGQYGEVYIKLEPNQRGAGFTFIDKITQGRIPSQYIPAVEKGVKEQLEKGVIAGYPVVDVQVTLYDGSYHEVDSSEASFKIAASKAFQAAFREARPVLLEPIVNMEVIVPSRFMGDITGDLNSRRGRIMGLDAQGDLQIIKVQIPFAEIINYSTELRSITAGEGSYSIEFSHYDIVPQRLAEGIIARAKRPKEEE